MNRLKWKAKKVLLTDTDLDLLEEGYPREIRDKE
jgi:hypothetical protein